MSDAKWTKDITPDMFEGFYQPQIIDAEKPPAAKASRTKKKEAPVKVFVDKRDEDVPLTSEQIKTFCERNNSWTSYYYYAKTIENPNLRLTRLPCHHPECEECNEAHKERKEVIVKWDNAITASMP